MTKTTVLNPNQTGLPGRSAAQRLVIAAVAIAALGFAPTARADGWPPSAAGTYAAMANLSTGLSLIITQPISSANCKPIGGTLAGDVIEGFYCPSSGRIAFVRKASNGVPFQHYKGTLNTESGSNGKKIITGNFAVWGATSGPGLYSFNATT